MNITCIELASRADEVVAFREDGRALQFCACFFVRNDDLPLRGYGSEWT